MRTRKRLVLAGRALPAVMVLAWLLWQVPVRAVPAVQSGSGGWIINEIHADPDADFGDANGDGSVGTTDDEFVEIVNDSATAVDISNWTLSDATGSQRHTFPSGTIVPAGCAVVVFGGGAPGGAFGGAVVQTASSGKLELNNTGDTLTLSDGVTAVVVETYGTEGGSDQSLTRFPDLTGSFVKHLDATGSGARFSAGTLVDGSAFTGCPDPAPAVTAVTPANGARSVALDASIQITFSEPVTVSGDWFQIVCSTSGGHTAVVSGGDAGYVLDPELDFVAPDFCSVTLTAEAIVDAAGQPLNGDYRWTFLAGETGWVINEIHADPHPDDGDANGDGIVDTTQDEFVEIVNVTGHNVDISGWTVHDGVGARHTFPSGTVVGDQCAIVVFGGGNPAGDFGGAVVQTASGLGLNNSDETVSLQDTALRPQAVVSYGAEGGQDQSLARVPDITGDFALHGDAAAGVLFSPGTQLDAAPFAGCPADAAPAVVATEPPNDATAVPVAATLSITFSEVVALDATAVTLDCSVSGSHTPTLDGGPTTFTAGLTLAYDEQCTVTVHGARVADQDADDPPDAMAADHVWQFSTESYPAADWVLINEVDADTPGSDTAEFIELYDDGRGNTLLNGLVLVLFNGSSDSSYRAFDLDGMRTDGRGYFVLELDSVLQNGADAVALYTGSAGDFPNGTAVTSDSLLDAVVYGTGDAPDAGLLALLNAGQPQLDEDDSVSSQRCPNGAGGQRNTAGFLPNPPTPGSANDCTVDLPPQVTGFTPSDGARDVALDARLTVRFSEPVTVADGWLTLTCVGAALETRHSGGPDAYTITPVDPLPDAAACRATVQAARVTDRDGRAQALPGDVSWSFETVTIPVADWLVINEVDADTPGSDKAEFVELYDDGRGDTDLTGLVLVLFNGSSDTSYRAYDLDGTTTNGRGYFVLELENVLQNGADAVALYGGSAGDFPNGTAVTSDNLLDAVVYGTGDTPDAGLLALLNRGQPQLDEDDSVSSQRCPNGAGGQRNTAGFLPNPPTPGSKNDCTVDQPPQITGFTPSDGARDVALDARLTVRFSEPVDVAAGWFALACDGAAVETRHSGGPDDYTITPVDPLPDAAACRATVQASRVTDRDGRPQALPGDVSWSFETVTIPVADWVLINEVDADTAGSDTAEFVELFDGGRGNTDLTGLVLVLFNGSSDTSYRAVDLDGMRTDGSGYFVLEFANVLQNGADAVALYGSSAHRFPSGTAVTTDNLLDAVVYGTGDAPDAGLLALLNAGQPQLDEDDSVSSQRCPDGAGGRRNTAGFLPNPPTPGSANDCTVDLPPAVTAVVPPDRATAVRPDVVIEITFSEPVATGEGWFALVCDRSGSIPALEDGVGATRTLTPVRPLGYDERCTVTLVAAAIVDQDRTPDPLPADVVWSFATAAADIVADFGENGPVFVGEVSSFTNLSSGPEPLRYAWDFGDGSLPATAVHPVHRYVYPGTYRVTLTVTHASGATAVVTREHTVLAVRLLIPAAFGAGAP